MEKLGIDPILILVQIINFSLLMFLLKKVLYKPVLKMIDDRKIKLQSIEKDKEEVLKEKEAVEASRKLIITSAEKEKKEMLEEARKEAENESKEILEKADKRAKEMIKNVSAQIEREKKISEKEMDKRVTELAVTMVEKISKNFFSTDAKAKSVQLAIQRFKKLNAEYGQKS